MLGPWSYVIDGFFFFNQVLLLSGEKISMKHFKIFQSVEWISEPHYNFLKKNATPEYLSFYLYSFDIYINLSNELFWYKETNTWYFSPTRKTQERGVVHRRKESVISWRLWGAIISQGERPSLAAESAVCVSASLEPVCLPDGKILEGETTELSRLKSN